MDTLEFESLLAEHGYVKKGSILFSKESTFQSVGDTVNEIDVGRFFLHSIPMVVRMDFSSDASSIENTIYYSFPIEYLSSYKYAMLQDNDQFFRILDQETKFDDILKVNYVSGKYLDIIAKLEYRYYITSEYVMLSLSRRTHL